MSSDPPSDELYMKGLPAGTTDDTLKAIFGVYGTVVSCRVLYAPTGVNDTAALVQMSSVMEAQYLVDNAVNIAAGLGSPVQIRFAHSKGSDKGGGGFGGQTPPGGAAVSGVPGSVSNRLYMKGLPIGISEEQLKTIMGAYGSVLSVKVLPAPPAGAPDSVAIVQMSSEGEAQWLIKHLDGNIPQGLSGPVQIRYKSDGPFPGGGVALASSPLAAFSAANIGGDGVSFPSDNLYIRGLPGDSTDQSLRTIFGVYGTVASVRVLPPLAGKSHVAALVRMGSVDEATWLVENLNGNIPQGLADPISVRFAHNPKGAGKGKQQQQALAGLDAFGAFGALQAGAAWTPQLPGAAAALAAGSPPAALPGAGPGAGLGQEAPGAPSSNLYIKGLPVDISDQGVNAILCAYGTILSTKVLPTPAGVNSAAALVQMGTAAEAQWMVDNVDQNIPEGLKTPIRISFASNPKGQGKGKYGQMQQFMVDAGQQARLGPDMAAMAQLGMTRMVAMAQGGEGGKGAPPGQPSDNVYIKGFPGDVDEMQLRAILGPYGNVVSCKFLPSPAGRTTAAALVRMGSVDEAMWLVENLNGNIPEGQTCPVEVKFAANNSGKGADGGKGASGDPYASGRWSPY